MHVCHNIVLYFNNILIILYGNVCVAVGACVQVSSEHTDGKVTTGGVVDAILRFQGVLLYSFIYLTVSCLFPFERFNG
jgi:hypothetical protein